MPIRLQTPLLGLGSHDCRITGFDRPGTHDMIRISILSLRGGGSHGVLSSTRSKAMERVHSDTALEGHASTIEETLSRALEPGDYM